MKTSVLLVLCVVAISSVFAGSWLDRLPPPDQFLSRSNIHQAVLALEREPLHKNADFIRPFLIGHFKKVDYLICGDVLGPLTEAKALQPIMWQIIIASGDWVEEHPERAKDIPAYTLAGLDSGVRAYKNLRAVKPAVKHKLMEELLAQVREWHIEAMECRASVSTEGLTMRWSERRTAQCRYFR